MGKLSFLIAPMLRCWVALSLCCALPAAAQDWELEEDDELGQDDDPEDDSDDFAETEDASDEDDGAEGEGAEDEPTSREPESAAWLALEVSVGVGAGTRAFERPIPVGTQKLPDTAFGAANLMARARLWPGDAVSLDLVLSYQTSLGMRIREPAPFALPKDIDVRSHRLALAFAPTLRLGDSARALALAFPLGFVVRHLWPQTDQYRTPEYMLGGAFIRPELLWPLTDSVRLRIGPEVQWLPLLDGTLTRSGVSCCQGVAIGAQGSLQADLSEAIAVELFYRESHASVSANRGTLGDVERFVTAGLVGRL
ncbi:MAG: hypothetical protein OXU20_00465 [Myxococcales bacterium]|nr:hypothetical protein [Myxococcales bacterium]